MTRCNLRSDNDLVTHRSPVLESRSDQLSLAVAFQPTERVAKVFLKFSRRVSDD